MLICTSEELRLSLFAAKRFTMGTSKAEKSALAEENLFKVH